MKNRDLKIADRMHCKITPKHDLPPGLVPVAKLIFGLRLGQPLRVVKA